MSDPSSPNYKNNVGRLVTDRFDFQKHVDGYSFHHTASAIDLSPIVSIGTPQNNVQDAIVALRDALTAPIVPDATTTTKGIIKLAGDITGTANSVSVIALRGFPVSATPPTNNYVLTWNGSAWVPAAISNTFSFSGDVTGTASSMTVVKLNGKPVASTAPSNNDTMIWNGSNWGPQALLATLIQYGGGSNWADGTTNPAASMEVQTDKILTDLSATTGDVKIGSPARSGSLVSLASGSVGTQITSLLSALNSFEVQKNATGGLASLDGSTKLTSSQRVGWIVSSDSGSGRLDGYAYDTTTSISYVDSMYSSAPIQVQFSNICNNGDIIMVQGHVRGQRANDSAATMLARIALVDGSNSAVLIGYEEELKNADNSNIAPGIMMHFIGQAVLSNVGTGGTATVKLQFKTNDPSFTATLLGPAYITATLIRP